MQLTINNLPAVLKENTGFEYISENRLFTDADDYTLSLSLPLRDCPQNLKIFGHINRADVRAGTLTMDCELRDRNFHKRGACTVTEITESEVKIQFLEGRSAQNFSRSLDDIIINTLDLGSPETLGASDVTPEEAWGDGSTLQPVALPWVNETTVSAEALIIQNGAKQNPDTGVWGWSDDTAQLSWQPYLLPLTQAILEAAGYEADLSAWESSTEHRYLLMCNTLPAVWDIPEFARALPAWSVREYLEQLELLLCGHFDIDNSTSKVIFSYISDSFATRRAIKLDDVEDNFSREQTLPEETESSYLPMRNLAYKDCDHSRWKYYSCRWFIDNYKKVVKFDTVSELLAATAKYKKWKGNTDGRGPGVHIDSLFYVSAVDTYFLIEPVSREYKSPGKNWPFAYWEYTCRLSPVNILGPRITDTREDADTEEISIVPAHIDDTGTGEERLLFLSPASYSENDGQSVPEEGVSFGLSDEFRVPAALSILSAGEKEKRAEYYDKIYVAWWGGRLPGMMYPENEQPHPVAEDIEVSANFDSWKQAPCGLRLRGGSNDRGIGIPDIDETGKSIFSFLYDGLPDVRAVFIIRNQRYLCAKLTATFTARGMSRRIKGEFYPIRE